MSARQAAKRKSTRGAPSPGRAQRREQYMSVPRTVTDCMVQLRILEYSQVYHDIILAIRQFTGYTKRFPNPTGQIRPRDTGAGGNLGSTFRSSFMTVVDSFLVERKGGVSFFTLIAADDAIQDYHDWEPRLIWENREDEEDIRVYMALLFEALKANGLPPRANGEPFDLERGNLVQSFDTPDCFVCGGSSGDNRVECPGCRCQFHRHCYDITDSPEDDQLWICRGCIRHNAEKALKKLKSVKRKDVDRTDEDEETLQQPPMKKRGSNVTFADSDSMFVSDDEGGDNASANNAGMTDEDEDEDEDKDNLAPISTNEPSSIAELATSDTRSLSDDRGRDHEPGNNAGLTEEDEASISELSSIDELAIGDTGPIGNDQRRDDKSANSARPEDEDESMTELSSVHEPVGSNRMPAGVDKARVDKPTTSARAEDEDESIFRDNRENMTVIVRLKLSDEFKPIDTRNVHSIEGLSGACGATWGVRVTKLYIYLPPNYTGALEIQAGGSKIFNMVVRYNQQAAKPSVSFMVRLIALVEGETYGTVDMDRSD